ncbi:MAG TPA: vWA domain-containing protein [Polyangiaceae bacterium]|nr:vWA domain-containing protein [Polyangiaceae bacterium]
MVGRSILASAVVSVFVMACGSGDPSSFPKSGSGGDGGSGNNPTFGSGSGSSGDGGANLSQCATSSATPTPVPVDLVFMFDKSGSMADSSKWTSCQSGLTSFFGDPNSAGLSASLQFFPQANECSASTYAAPSVSLRALPDNTTFANAMNNNAPGGGTPTVPALTGAIQYAQSIQTASPGDKVAVVLVTDGQPNDCNSTVQAVAAVAASAAATIPTFVVGVGNTGNLDAIALAGGTTKATIVSTNNPAQTAQDFQTALEAIRGLTLACEFQIPPPPQGETFDEAKVNVVFTPTNASPETLSYNQDCTGGTGWHYDDPNNPKKIELCASTCGDVQKDKSGKIDIVFGCATNGVIPK